MNFHSNYYFEIIKKIINQINLAIRHFMRQISLNYKIAKKNKIN